MAIWNLSESKAHVPNKNTKKKSFDFKTFNPSTKLRIVGNCNAFAAILQSGKVVTWNCDYDKDELYDIQHIEHSLYDFIALRKDGTVVTWGNGRNYKVPELKEVCQIAASSSAFAALQVDGKVVTWGLGPLGGDSSGVAEQLQNVIEVNASVKILPGVTKRKATEL